MKRRLAAILLCLCTVFAFMGCTAQTATPSPSPGATFSPTPALSPSLVPQTEWIQAAEQPRYTQDAQLTLPGFEDTPLSLRFAPLEGEEFANNPLLVTLEIGSATAELQSPWNDGIYAGSADFNKEDGAADVYLLETGTDIGAKLYIYRYDGSSITLYATIELFGSNFAYDGQGGLYYSWGNEEDMSYNTRFDYASRKNTYFWQ